MAITYTLHLDFQDNLGFINYSHLLTGENFTRNLSVGDIGTHEISTLEMTLRADNALFIKLLNTNNFIKAKIDRNSSPYFRGIIRPNVEFSIEEKLKNITLEVIDNSYLLEKNPTQTKYWENKKVCDNNDKPNSLIHLLLEDAGLLSTDYEIDVYEPAVLNIVKIEEKDTYEKIIEKVLFEYGLNYYFDVDGKFKVKNVSPENISPLITFDNYNIIQPLEISKEEKLSDGVVVNSNTITLKNGVLVYRGVYDPERPALISPNLYYPPNANNVDITQALSLVVKNDNETLFFSMNHELELTKDDDVIVAHETYTPETAQIYFKNTNPVEVQKLYRFDIRADAYVKGKAFEAIIDGKNLETYDAEYIYSEESARKLAKVLKARQEYGRYSFTINSTKVYPIGSVANLQDSSTGLNLTVFVYSRVETDGNPIITYQARSLTELQSYNPTILGRGFFGTEPVNPYGGETGEKGNKGEDVYGVQISCPLGNFFRTGEPFETQLIATVFKGGINITDLLEPEDFRWVRYSGAGYETEDATWNSTKGILGGSVLEIDASDVLGRSVFTCELLNTVIIEPDPEPELEPDPEPELEPDPEPEGTLEETPWEVIASLESPSEYFAVGDEKTITLSTNEVITLQIYDFDHDDLVSGGKASITFGMKNLMNDARAMNSAYTNKGGWDATVMRTWLNGALYNSLPSDVKAVIKPVYKKTANGGSQSGTTVINSNDKVFLFSQVETGAGESYVRAGEGTAYPIFTDNASRIKQRNGSNPYWWSRSPRSSNGYGFRGVGSDGSSDNYDANNSYGVCFGFCVGGEE